MLKPTGQQIYGLFHSGVSSTCRVGRDSVPQTAPADARLPRIRKSGMTSRSERRHRQVPRQDRDLIKSNAATVVALP